MRRTRVLWGLVGAGVFVSAVGIPIAVGFAFGGVPAVIVAVLIAAASMGYSWAYDFWGLR